MSEQQGMPPDAGGEAPGVGRAPSDDGGMGPGAGGVGPDVEKAAPVEREVRASRTGAYIRLGIVALIVAFVLVFVFQNTGKVSLSFIAAEFTAPAWLMLLIVLLIGVVVGFFLGRKSKRARPR